MSARKLDVVGLIERPENETNIRVRSKKSPEEIALALELKRANALHAQWRERFLLRAAAVAGMACFSLAFLPVSSDDVKKTIAASLAPLVTAGLGFAAGKNAKWDG